MTSSRPALRFYHSAPLRTRTNKVLAAIERSPDPAAHADELGSVVVALTEAGIDFYFLKAMREAKLRYIAPHTAEIAVAGAIRALTPVLRSVLRSASGAQLRVIAKHVRGLME